MLVAKIPFAITIHQSNHAPQTQRIKSNIAEDMLEVYLNHHKDQPNSDEVFILE
jgi:hypothetical protein